MMDQEDRSYTKENVKTAIIEYYANYESASTSELAKASGISAKTIRRSDKTFRNRHVGIQRTSQTSY